MSDIDFQIIRAKHEQIVELEAKVQALRTERDDLQARLDSATPLIEAAEKYRDLFWNTPLEELGVSGRQGALWEAKVLLLERATGTVRPEATTEEPTEHVPGPANGVIG